MRVLLAALLMTTLVYGAMPAGPAHASTFLINDLSDPAPGSITLDGICDITPGDGVDNCTLREAIMESNRVDDVDTINFNNVPTMTIVLTQGALPVITQPVTIDGTTSGGRVTVDGGGAAIIGFNIQSSNVTLTGLALIDFDNTAIRVSNNADMVVIDDNYIGVARDGTTDGGNTEKGIRVVDSPNVTITNNLISGNDLGGVVISGAASDGAVIQGNIIGLNAAADARLEATPTTGADGIRLTGVTNAVIGGSTTAERNIVSGNYGNGIVVTGTATGTTIDGNYVGVSGIGEDPLPNLSGGIRLSNTVDVSVGSNQKNLISGNDAPGMVISSSSSITVENNVIGLDVDGDTIIGNTAYGINITSSSDTTISNNVISGNTGSGIRMADGTTTVTLTKNRIGVGEFTNANLGNTNHGIYIDNSYDNIIGGTLFSDSNRIAFNDSNGIYIANTDPLNFNSNGNTIVHNSISHNGNLGIDLAPFGVTANDSGDPDTGPNTLQNYITFTAQLTDAGVHILGTLDTDSMRPNYRIDFYVNNSCDSSGYGEGTIFLDIYELTVTADVTALDFEIPTTSVSEGQFLTATVTYDEVTGGLKDTSEFSPCAVVQEKDSPGSSGVFVVNSTADTAETPGQVGDGFCNVGGGVCTLRAAIQEANDGTEPPYTISFSIPGITPHVISVGSPLPTITVPVIIKGKPSGYTGPPFIVLDGTGAIGADGFVINANGTKVDGLSIINFSNGAAVRANATDVIVKNNYLGLSTDGITVGPNQSGVYINGTTNNNVTGNVISGNLYGVRLVGSAAQNNKVTNNYIGTDSAGTLDRGNTSDGLRIEGGHSNTIGGLSSADRNVISGNNGDGVEISGGGTGNKIYNNYIGVNATGSGSLANNNHGINVNSSSNNLITYGNSIGHNGIAGVAVSVGNGNLISSNSIFENASTGIQLSSGGNDDIPAPVLTFANQGGSYIYVEGAINGAQPSTQYTLEFFTNTVSAQGETLVFTSQVTTDASGNVSFSAGPPVSVPDLTLVTASMRDGNNNSSEFSNGVYVAGSAPKLTNTPTNTPTITNTPTPTLNLRPTFTYTPTYTFTPTNTKAPRKTNTPTNTPTNTKVANTSTNTPVPTKTTGGGGGATVTLANTATSTITDTPTITNTPTLISQYQTLTALATENTVEPTNTPEEPTQTRVPSNTPEPPTSTPTDTPLPSATIEGDGAADGSGGGGTEPQPAGIGGDSGLNLILYIFIGLAALLLLVGGGMELMRWMNSRE
jgi:CSLREA domain-containing protein